MAKGAAMKAMMKDNDNNEDDKEKDKKNGTRQQLFIQCSVGTKIQERIPDVVSKVLTRTPIKNEFQCKGVSKDWRSIITDTSFLKAYNARHPTPGDLLISSVESAFSTLVRFFYSTL